MSNPISDAQLANILRAAALSPWRKGPNCCTRNAIKAHKAYRENAKREEKSK